MLYEDYLDREFSSLVADSRLDRSILEAISHEIYRRAKARPIVATIIQNQIPFPDNATLTPRLRDAHELAFALSTARRCLEDLNDDSGESQIINLEAEETRPELDPPISDSTSDLNDDDLGSFSRLLFEFIFIEEFKCPFSHASIAHPIVTPVLIVSMPSSSHKLAALIIQFGLLTPILEPKLAVV